MLPGGEGWEEVWAEVWAAESAATASRPLNMSRPDRARATTERRSASRLCS